MKLIPISTLVRYLHATRGYGPQQDESLLDAVADQICAAENIERTSSASRKFIERHREAVVSKAPRAAKNPIQAAAREAKRPPAKLSGDLVATDEFLRSYEWRRIRMQALKRLGARCMCCGDSPANGAVINVDHIKPRRLFPALALDIDNLQVLCGPCNHGKGNWDMTDWRGTLVSVP